MHGSIIDLSFYAVQHHVQATISFDSPPVRMCQKYILKIRNLHAGRLLICGVLNCKLHIESEDPQ
jgi:hypothetical protein